MSKDLTKIIITGITGTVGSNFKFGTGVKSSICDLRNKNDVYYYGRWDFLRKIRHEQERIGSVKGISRKNTKRGNSTTQKIGW